MAAQYDTYQDCVTKIVLIGMGMNQERPTRMLDEALLTPEELSAEWRSLPDPLPPLTS